MPTYRERANNSTTPYNSGRLKTETSSVEVVVRESESHALEVESLSRVHLIASGRISAFCVKVTNQQTQNVEQHPQRSHQGVGMPLQGAWRPANDNNGY